MNNKWNIFNIVGEQMEFITNQMSLTKNDKDFDRVINGSPCYICGKNTTEMGRVSESPKDELGIKVPMHQECMEELQNNG